MNDNSPSAVFGSSSLFGSASRPRRRGASGLCAAWIATGAAAAWLGAPLAMGACNIHVVGEINVDTAHNRVVTQGEIDGKPARIMIDTGGSTSWLWSDSAERFGLRLTYEGRVKIYGIGGEAQPSQTIVKHLQIGTIYGNNVHLIVLKAGANRPPGAPDLVLGNDMFARFDTEFDLAHGKIRLLRPDGCKTEELPYWADTYSQADLESGGVLNALIRTRVLVNGKSAEAELDTGSPASAITRQAAEDAGVTPWTKDPRPSGMIYGIGAKPVEVWVGTFDSFSMGDETIRNVPLRIADLFGADKSVALGSRIATDVGRPPTMLIGCDFFQVHHLLVLPKERKLLFTYNGGTVFQIPPSGPAPGSVPAPVAAPVTSPSPATSPATSPASSTTPPPAGH
jgi:predicted aspartyl protease